MPPETKSPPPDGRDAGARPEWMRRAAGRIERLGSNIDGHLQGGPIRDDDPDFVRFYWRRVPGKSSRADRLEAFAEIIAEEARAEEDRIDAEALRASRGEAAILWERLRAEYPDDLAPPRVADKKKD